MLRWSLFIIGLCMMGAGVVPINFSDPVHSTFIRVLGVVFIVLLASIQLWLPASRPPSTWAPTSCSAWESSPPCCGSRCATTT
ncbi:hypothetical protein ACFFX0_33000 [Citricoccus parietis]|uniref:EamA domain-containing protein n=1 Tax=Citricoccus parietis TaxID=592307 RepID=A0ABV5GAT2_9MICC